MALERLPEHQIEAALVRELSPGTHGPSKVLHLVVITPRAVGSYRAVPADESAYEVQVDLGAFFR